MSTKTKLDKQRKAQEQITDMLYAAFLKIPKEEQKATIRAIQKIKIVKNRKTSKHSSIPVSLRQSSKAVSSHGKHAHR